MLDTLRASAVVIGAALMLISADVSPAGAGQAAHGGKDYVLSGKVTAGGKVVVVASIWPNDAHTSTPGNTIQMQQLDAVVTGSGLYRIRIPARTVTADHESPQGSIDVRLIVSDGTSAQIREVTAQLALPTVVETADLARRPQATVQRTVEDAAGPVVFDSAQLLPGLTKDVLAATTVASDVTRAAHAPAERVSVANASLVSEAALPTLGCYVVTGAQHGPYNETFTRIYGTANVKGKIDQRVGSAHTIGIAVKGAGAWGASGTKTISTSARWYSDYNVVDAAAYNKVYQRYYYTKCNTTGAWETVATQSKPTAFHSGPYFSRASHVNYAYCTPAYPQFTYERDHTRQGAIGGGMDLPFVNVSAQSGWDVNTIISYRFARAGKICGSNARWQEAAYISATA